MRCVRKMIESNLSFPRRIAVLGASGTIGQLAVELIAKSKGRLVASLLSVHSNTRVLLESIQHLQKHNAELPSCVVVTDENADKTPLKDLPKNIELIFGHDALCNSVKSDEIDIVLSAIVGIAGLKSTIAAAEAGKIIALANKESLVSGGALLNKLNPKILPVDSEHSAILQCLQGESKAHVARLILTASGGPFRTKSLEDLAGVTIKDALSHPTWSMGKKITIDSATLMNKALELIEAHWLFGFGAEQLAVVLHPQSIVHSFVEYIDGSVIAQMSPPDMRLPIQYALYYPERFDGPAKRMDWQKCQTLEFIPPCLERFPAIKLGLDVIRRGGTAGAAINAANEAAVAAFLNGQLPFNRIVDVCEEVLGRHCFEAEPTLDCIFEIDDWARDEAKKFI